MMMALLGRLTALFAFAPISFNVAYSIGFAIGAPWWLWWFQHAEILGIPGLGIRVHLIIIGSLASFAYLAPLYLSAGVGAGFICGAVWVMLIIHGVLGMNEEAWTGNYLEPNHADN